MVVRFCLGEIVAPFLHPEVSEGETGLRVKNKVICGCVEAEAFVGLPGGGSVSRNQMESQVWISGVRIRSY